MMNPAWLEEKWVEIACNGCKKVYLVNWAEFRICSECLVNLYEGLAFRLDKSYNKSIINEWETVENILAKLYGKNWNENYNQ